GLQHRDKRLIPRGIPFELVTGLENGDINAASLTLRDNVHLIREPCSHQPYWPWTSDLAANRVRRQNPRAKRPALEPESEQAIRQEGCFVVPVRDIDGVTIRVRAA